MQIIIKQSEIEVAVKNYIAGLGINLTGKDVEVSFTAGRKEDGLSASLDIVDSGATSTPVVPLKAVLEAAAPAPVAQAITQPVPTQPAPVRRAPVAVEEAKEAVAAAPVVEEAPATEAEVPAAEVEAANDTEVQPAKKVSSLFG